MKKILLLVGVCANMISIAAQNNKNEDLKSIKAMSGCYEVSFNYTETFSPIAGYKFHDKEASKGLEYIKVIEDKNNEVSLQHLLIVNTPDSTFIVKHWRQDWQYENTDLYSFDKDNTWKFVSLPKNQVAGQWTQKVYQVDDSPRYEGSSTWVHVDGKNYWENTADAPLPRREYTKRSDYNVLKRTNRQELTDYGWIHIQDNYKILRKDGQKDVLIAQERGENTYKRVDVSRCAPAEKWWVNNGNKWNKVRSAWNNIYKRNVDLKIKNLKKDTEIFEALSNLKSNSAQKDVNTVINNFLQ